MRIVEQSFIATDRMTAVKTEYPTEALFQVFVKGKLHRGKIKEPGAFAGFLSSTEG